MSAHDIALGTLIAEWFAAVGTVGALLLGIWLFWHERRMARRRDADSFVSWISLAMTESGSWRQRVDVRNVGTRPIVNVTVCWEWERGTGAFTIAEIFPRRGEDVFMPGDAGKTAPRAHTGALFVLSFTDSEGKTWYRNLLTNKYMGRRRGSRIVDSAKPIW